MPRISRQDEPGSWQRVFNRAIARRALFERREDYRFFLASLARVVRRGEIEVHAYCLMGMHYHLLLRDVKDTETEQYPRGCHGRHSARLRPGNKKRLSHGPSGP